MKKTFIESVLDIYEFEDSKIIMESVYVQYEDGDFFNGEGFWLE